MLSIIIPSYKDQLLNRTIDSLLENATGDIEIIPVLDGYFQEVKQDPRVHPIHLHQNKGMKNAINKGMSMARGEYVMRLDEHCMVAPGFDTEITKMEYDWMVTPRRFFLDPVKWEVMDIPPVDYEKLLIIDEPKKFSGVRWTSRTEKLKDIPVDETMMMQGSCVVMSKYWWNTVIQDLQWERYGTLYQDQTEMAFKTWKAGGKLMVNKNTWFAHKHRSFPRTHNHDSVESRNTFAQMLTDYGDYYNEVIKPKWGI